MSALEDIHSPDAVPSRPEAELVMRETAALIGRLRLEGRDEDADDLTRARDAYGRNAARYFALLETIGGTTP